MGSRDSGIDGSEGESMVRGGIVRESLVLSGARLPIRFAPHRNSIRSWKGHCNIAITGLPTLAIRILLDLTCMHHTRLSARTKKHKHTLSLNSSLPSFRTISIR